MLETEAAKRGFREGKWVLLEAGGRREAGETRAHVGRATST